MLFHWCLYNFGGYFSVSIQSMLPEKLIFACATQGHTLEPYLAEDAIRTTQRIMIVRGEEKGRPGNRIYLILESISQVFILQILGYYGSRGNVLSWLENTKVRLSRHFSG